MTELLPDALPEYEALPAYPSSKEDFDVWLRWVQHQLEIVRVPTLHVEPALPSTEDGARQITTWRALIAYWAQGRSVSADDVPQAAFYLLSNALSAPPFVYLAAKNLTWAVLRSGSTSTDALYLAATWAWPLRDAEPELSRACWQYLVHAPWQTDSRALRDLLAAVHNLRAFRDGRSIMDLVERKLASGRRFAAKEWLEAVALVQARKESLEQILSYRDFVTAPLLQEANEALVRLAQLYMDEGADQVWAREILKRAAELTRSYTIIEFIESRVWDRPMAEAYRWCEQVTHPRMLDDEIQAALNADQPHHARRLAEAMIVRRFNRVWYGAATDNVVPALDKLQRQIALGPPADPVARRASEHLAMLYMRTFYATQHARQFVMTVADSIAYTGKGALLYDVREELELFYNRSDPYHILRSEATLLGHAQHAMSDDERAASDEVDRWFQTKFRAEQPNALDRFARWITAPLSDATRYFSGLPIYEEIVTSVMQVLSEHGGWLAGDLSKITHEAAIIRSQYGHGIRLMEYAKEVSSLEAIIAASIAAGSSILSPGLSLAAHAADLGSSLLLALRAIARVAAVFGRDIQAPDGFKLVADSLTLGFSSPEGEGLLTYFSQPSSEMLRAISIGGVTYGSSRLVEYLWSSPHQQVGARLGEQSIRYLARVVGMELGQDTIVKLVPLVGAMISGVSTWVFMRKIIDTAIHVAARDALMVRAAVYEQAAEISLA